MVRNRRRQWRGLRAVRILWVGDGDVSAGWLGSCGSWRTACEAGVAFGVEFFESVIIGGGIKAGGAAPEHVVNRPREQQIQVTSKFPPRDALMALEYSAGRLRHPSGLPAHHHYRTPRWQ
jgi:hypothetical protein